MAKSIPISENSPPHPMVEEIVAPLTVKTVAPGPDAVISAGRTVVQQPLQIPAWAQGSLWSPVRLRLCLVLTKRRLYKKADHHMRLCR